MQRFEVLKAFKRLHRVSREVFEDDLNALKITRDRINDEFKKNQSVNELKKINELVEFANAVAHELKTTVIQAYDKGDGVYRLKIRKDVLRDNFENCKK